MVTWSTLVSSFLHPRTVITLTGQAVAMPAKCWSPVVTAKDGLVPGVGAEGASF